MTAHPEDHCCPCCTQSQGFKVFVPSLPLSPPRTLTRTTSVEQSPLWRCDLFHLSNFSFLFICSDVREKKITLCWLETSIIYVKHNRPFNLSPSPQDGAACAPLPLRESPVRGAECIT